MFIIGILPPPLGGVAIHIQRVINKLALQGCIVEAWDVCRAQQGLNQFDYYLKLLRTIGQSQATTIIYQTVHLRGTGLELLIIWLGAWWSRKELIVVVHSARFIQRWVWHWKKVLNWVCSQASQIVLVSPQVQQELEKHRLKFKDNLRVEEPFLPPDLSQKEQILAQLPENCKLFIDNHRPLVVVTVTRMATWHGQDLYGLDLALEAWPKFLAQFPQTGLLVAIAHLEPSQKIQLPKNCYLLANWPHELWPVIAQADLFLRPTRSDGYSVSVSEAIYFKIPAIASNVCPRPTGTILFKSGCAKDLAQQMATFWQNTTTSSLLQPRSKTDMPHSWPKHQPKLHKMQLGKDSR